MGTRMERGAADASVTELLSGVEFRDVKNGACGGNGFVKRYKNGYNKVG